MLVSYTRQETKKPIWGADVKMAYKPSCIL